MPIECPKCHRKSLEYQFEHKKWMCLFVDCDGSMKNKWKNPTIVSTFGIEHGAELDKTTNDFFEIIDMKLTEILIRIKNIEDHIK